MTWVSPGWQGGVPGTQDQQAECCAHVVCASVECVWRVCTAEAGGQSSGAEVEAPGARYMGVGEGL